MEIIVHTIKELNRLLNLGLYILLDSDRICLSSLTIGAILKEMPSGSTLEFYRYLVELKRQITSWDLNRMNGRDKTAHTIRGQIFVNYKFDIEKHYKLSKYGKYV